MIIRTFEIDTEEHARMLEQHVSKLDFVKLVNEKRRITPYDLAFGIGRPLTDEEWQQYFKDFPNTDKPISAEDAKRQLKEKSIGFKIIKAKY